jgi:hypothetical protein
VSDLVKFLRARLAEDEEAARKAAELCGCHPPAPSWTFDDEETDGRILITDNPHPDIRHKLNRRWNGTYQGLHAAEHIARHDPARVLAEVEARRRIIDEHEVTDQGCETCGNYDPTGLHEYRTDGPCTTLRLLALPYADHPDYREEWKP